MIIMYSQPEPSFPFITQPAEEVVLKTRHPYWLRHHFSKVLNPLPPLNSLVWRLAGVSDDQSLLCSIMMKNVGENVCCLLFPRRMRTENSEKVSRKQQTLSPPFLWSQKDCSSLYGKLCTMKVYRQIKILALFLLQKIITMKQYIISLFMGKVCCWYLFLISPGLILVQSSLLFSTLG